MGHGELGWRDIAGVESGNENREEDMDKGAVGRGDEEERSIYWESIDAANHFGFEHDESVYEKIIE